MSQLFDMPAQPSAMDDDAWGDLIDYIEDRRVIPIIGPELLIVDTDTGPRLLYEWLAEKLAGKLSVDTTRLPENYSLNDVVCAFLAARGRRESERTARTLSRTTATIASTARTGEPPSHSPTAAPTPLHVAPTV